MKRIQYLAGLALALTISSSADGNDQKHYCPEEVKQKLLRLDGRFQELEALIESAVLSGKAPAKTKHVEIAGLEKQVGELEALLRTLGRQPIQGAQLAALEKQVGELETLLEQDPEAAGARPPIDASRMVDLEKRIGDLQESLRRNRESETRRKAADQTRITSLETQVSQLQNALQAIRGTKAGRQSSNEKLVAGLEQQLAELESLLQRSFEPVTMPDPADKARIAELEKLLAESRKALAARTTAEATQMNHLESQVAELEKLLANLSAPADSREIARLENEKRELQTRLDRGRKDAANRDKDQETRLASLQQELAQARKALASRSGADTRSIATLEAQVGDLEQLLANLGPAADIEELARLQRDNRELQDRLSQSKEAAANRQTADRNQIAGLESEVASLEKQLQMSDSVTAMSWRQSTDATAVENLERQMSSLERLIRREKPTAALQPPPRAQSQDNQEMAALQRQVARLEGMLEASLLRQTAAPQAPAPAENARILESEKQLAVLEERLRHSAQPDPVPSLDRELAARLEAQIAGLEIRLGEAARSSAPDPPVVKPRMRVVRPVPKLTPAPVTSPPARAPATVSTPPISRARTAVGPGAGNQSICATLRLRSKPDIPKPISPHGPNFLGIFTYDVLDGPAAGQTIQVAHGVRWANKSTCVTTRKIGTELVLDVVPLWWLPKLKGVPIVGNGVREKLYLPRIH